MRDKMIEEIADKLLKSRLVVVFTGAGISAESGIPTFRDAGGLWEGYDPMKVASPEGFYENPELVWRFYHERRKKAREVRPNPGHTALAELENILPELYIITQNIDNLHQRAGSKNVIEIHGNLFSIKCTNCPYKTKINWEKEDNIDGVPKCPECGAILRPDVVWFGEMLPEGELSRAMELSRRCDVFFSIGTSAAAYPAAGLIWDAKDGGAFLVEINPNRTEVSGIVDVRLEEKSGVVLPEILNKVKELKNE